MPVSFFLSLNGKYPSEEETDGRWQPYVRGPREIVPWLDAPQLAADAVDATPDGGVLALGQGPQLAIPASGD